MRSDQLIAALRQDAMIGDAASFPEYPDTKLLDELNDKQRSVYSDIIIKARCGYWVKDQLVTTTAARNRYRIPPRSCVGGLEKLELRDGSSGSFARLNQVPISQAQRFEGASGSPSNYTISGDQLVLFPTPSAAQTLRITFYIRPSLLVRSQCSTAGGDAVDRGRITAINGRALTVNALPFDQSLAVPAAITTAVQAIDVVHPDGWHELAAVGQSQSIAGLVITVGGTDDLSDVAIGDYVRVADQTDWPCLPDDFHRSLADVAAIKVLEELHILQKAEAIRGSVGNDLTRFQSLISQQVKSEPKQIPLRLITRGR